ncbi:hypothetical protein ACNYDH_17045 [Phocaeicola vulgatus]|uniref:hypothetical protein n=1 Tax=Bacteroidaceae TaxID=815 RepID=UPI00155E906C|nr:MULTISPECIES: hypothetical protein [Bacteroidaceae]QRN01463.1 hypothetical protein GFH35_23910 [Bacteroides xylanisolvens]
MRKIFCKRFDIWWEQPTFAKKYPRRQDEKTVSGHFIHHFTEPDIPHSIPDRYFYKTLQVHFAPSSTPSYSHE